jgi:hypothetical protein
MVKWRVEPWGHRHWCVVNEAGTYDSLAGYQRLFDSEIDAMDRAKLLNALESEKPVALVPRAEILDCSAKLKPVHKPAPKEALFEKIFRRTLIIGPGGERFCVLPADGSWVIQVPKSVIGQLTPDTAPELERRLRLALRMLETGE